MMAVTEKAVAALIKTNAEAASAPDNPAENPFKGAEAEPGQTGAARATDVEARNQAAQTVCGADVVKVSSEVEFAKRLAPREEPQIQLAPGHASFAQAHAAGGSRTAEATAPGATQFLEQVADRIRLQIREDSGEIRIQLKPEFLGHLEIKAETGANGIVARIAASSESVKAFLESNLPILQHNLQIQGLRVEKIDVVVQQGFNFSQTTAQQQSPGHSSGSAAGESSHGPGTGSHASGTFGSDDLTPDGSIHLHLGPNSTFHTVA
jgi:flagellar hook-length control protein FliK